MDGCDFLWGEDGVVDVDLKVKVEFFHLRNDEFDQKKL